MFKVSKANAKWLRDVVKAETHLVLSMVFKPMDNMWMNLAIAMKDALKLEIVAMTINRFAKFMVSFILFCSPLYQF